MFAFPETNLKAFIFPNVCSADPRPSREALFTLGEGSSAFFLSTEECWHLSLEVLSGSPYWWLLLFPIPGRQDWALAFILRMLRLALLPGPARAQEPFSAHCHAPPLFLNCSLGKFSLLPYACLLWMTQLFMNPFLSTLFLCSFRFFLTIT